MMKKAVSLVLAVCLLFGCFPLGASAYYYYDDVNRDDWFATAIAYSYTYNLMNGTGGNSFSPNSVMNRGMIVTVLYRLFGSPEVSSLGSFADVPVDAYYAQAVKWAVDKNITQGTGNNHFSPSSACTRAQIVTFLWRAAGQPEPAKSENPFDDVKPEDYFYSAVLWAVENKITTGTSVSIFAPADNCTRAQGATFLMRFREYEIVEAQNHTEIKVEADPADTFIESFGLRATRDPTFQYTIVEKDKNGKATQVFSNPAAYNPFWNNHSVYTYESSGKVSEVCCYSYLNHASDGFYGYTKYKFRYNAEGALTNLTINRIGGDDGDTEYEAAVKCSGQVMQIYGSDVTLSDIGFAIDTQKYTTIEEYSFPQIYDDMKNLWVDDINSEPILEWRYNFRDDGQISSVYNSRNNCVSRYGYNPNGDLVSKTENKYDIYDPDIFKTSYQIAFSYDNSGKIKRKTISELENGSYKESGYYSYVYYSNGNLAGIDYTNVQDGKTIRQHQVLYEIDGTMRLEQFP